MRRSLLASSLLGLCLGLFTTACSDDDDDGAGNDGGTGGSASDGGTGGTPGDGGSECTVTLSAGDDDTRTVQEALINAMSGDTICLSPGTYSFESELSLAEHQNITLRGAGENRDDVVLDFADQSSGDDGMTVTADGFTIEHLWIKNTVGNGIVVRADDSHFNDIKVSWDAGAVMSNGAYAVYPTTCNNTLVENIEVTGASDAGIYVGQCRGAIVRNNKAYSNVLGIEIENTVDADVYGNEVYDNAGGILVDLLPFKDLKEARNTLVRDNDVYDNNRENFGEPGTVVAAVPPGTGIMVLAASDTEIRDNSIRDHDGPGVIVISYDTVDLLLGSTTDDPGTDRYPKNTYIHDNTFEGNGLSPAGAYSIFERDPLENVIWDGIVDPDLAGDAEVKLCLGTAEAMSFLNFAADEGLEPAAQSTDVTAHTCELDSLPELSF